MSIEHWTIDCLERIKVLFIASHMSPLAIDPNAFGKMAFLTSLK